MQSKTIATLVLLILFIYLTYHYFTNNKETQIMYLPGKVITKIVKDTVEVKDTVRIKGKVITIKVPQESEVDSPEVFISTEWIERKFDKDSLQGFEEKIRFYKDEFQFKDTKMWFYSKELKSVDTVLISKIIKTEFYEHTEFWVTAAAAAIAIISLIK